MSSALNELPAWWYTVGLFKYGTLSDGSVTVDVT